MNSFISIMGKQLLLCGAVLGILTAGLATSLAIGEGGLGFTLDSDSYTVTSGHSVSGTLTGVPVNDGVNNWDDNYDDGTNEYWGQTWISYYYEGYEYYYYAPWYIYYYDIYYAYATVQLLDANNSIISTGNFYVSGTGSFSLSTGSGGSPGADVFGTVNVLDTDPYWDNDDEYTPTDLF